MKSVLHTLVLLLCLFSITAHAQSTPPPSALRLNIGLGLNSLGSLAGVASLHTGFGPVVLSLRTTANSESVRLFKEKTEMFDLGILAGWRYKNEKVYLSLASGVASVYGWHNVPGEWFGGGSRERLGPVVGLPFEGQVFFSTAGALGIGLYAYANVNQERSFSGVAICLRLGSLR